MTLRNHILLMANYNQWMNVKLYEAAGKLSQEELTTNRKAFFGSLLGTLNHIVVITRHKTAGATGKRTIYDYALVPERLDAVRRALAVRPALSPFLFCNRRGEGYFNEATGLCNGWDSIWQRFMDRVLAESKVTERFTEHDLRAKVGSDAVSLEKARALLQHADARTTARIYRRKPERV